MKHVTKDWVLAGEAIFTINTPTDGHRTYRVSQSEPTPQYPNPAYFVSLLTGPDNTNSYTYLGLLDANSGAVRLTKKSKLPADAFPIRLLSRTLARVWVDDHAAYESHGFATAHCGRCGRCGRRLTVPESVESGFGPECARLV